MLLSSLVRNAGRVGSSSARWVGGMNNVGCVRNNTEVKEITVRDALRFTSFFVL